MDEALRGIVPGLVGALSAFSIYSFRHMDHPGVGEVGPQLAAEIASFTVVVTSLICGFVALLRERIGRFPAIALIATLLGPPAVSFATGRFGQFPIPFVDQYVVLGGLLATFVLLLRRFAPSASFLRTFAAVCVAALPFALIAALTAPGIRTAVMEYRESAQRIDPYELGALAGCLIGPMCGLWVCLALWMAQPVPRAKA